MTLLKLRCNPYGFTTDAGPRHLMGGIFGPEYAGPDLVLADGIHGIGVCVNEAQGWFVMRCPAGHTGPRMPLCPDHVGVLQARYSACCTRCVMPPESRALWEDQERATAELRRAFSAGDRAAVARIQSRIEDIGREQVALTMRGLTPKRPMKLVEIS